MQCFQSLAAILLFAAAFGLESAPVPIAEAGINLLQRGGTFGPQGRGAYGRE